MRFDGATHQRDHARRLAAARAKHAEQVEAFLASRTSTPARRVFTAADILGPPPTTDEIGHVRRATWGPWHPEWRTPRTDEAA